MKEAESVSLKLGVDGSQVGPDMEKFKQKVTGNLRESHQWFEHIGSSGRAFHKVMERITEQSPILGSALRLAISPVTGAVMAAGLAFSFVSKQIEEVNKHLDEMRDRNAKPFGDFEGGKSEAANRKEEIAKGRRELQESLHNKDNPVITALLKEQETRDKTHELAKELRDDEYEHAKRRIEDAARLEKEAAEESFKFREKYAEIHHASTQSRLNLSEEKTRTIEGIEENQRVATRALEDRHKQQERADKERADQEKRASLERARGKLTAETADQSIKIGEEEDKQTLSADTNGALNKNAAAQRKSLEEAIAKIKSELPKIEEEENDREKTRPTGFLSALGQVFTHPGDIISRATNKEGQTQKLKDELTAYQKALDKTIESQEKLKNADKESAETLANLRKEYAKNRQTLDGLEKQINKLPATAVTVKHLKYGDEGYLDEKDKALSDKLSMSAEDQWAKIRYDRMSPAEKAAFDKKHANTAKPDEPLDKRTLEEKFSDMAASLKALEDLAKGNGIKTTVDVKD